MTDDSADFRTITERLTRLEKQNSMFRRVGVALLIVAGAFLFMGQAPPKHHGIEEKLISTQKLILTDAAGNIKGWLSARDGNRVALVFNDSKGNPAIALDVSQDKPRIYVNGENGAAGAVLAPTSIALIDNASPKTVSLSMLPSGAGLYVDDGIDTGAALKLLPTGPLLELFYKSQTKEATLSYTKDGPSLELEDAQGYSTVVGSASLVTPTTGETHQTSAASLVLFSKDKHVIWKAP